ncbi:MAG TPA: macrocin-O-methyltransferase [Candidatus Magasanikbacteria bacterium]|nr:macrocin-O-methyltransferase [Candidatus Magasanikbacteria bacterium]
MLKQYIKKFVVWLAHFNIINACMHYVILERKSVLLRYDDERKAPIFSLIQKVKHSSNMLLKDNEAYQIYMIAKRTAKIPGVIAEVGVYRGGSAKLICEAKGDRPLYLFDTFDGLPDPDACDDPKFYKGQFDDAVFEEVKNYLKGYPNVFIYQGLFPQTAQPILDKRFSFVNLDVDIYESTRSCLEFFYPRMSRGGFILSHDYSNSAGVRRAFDEFFSSKPEAIVEMSGTQCLVIKV